MEHRCEERFEANLVVTLNRMTGQPIRGVMANLSCSGGFVRLPPNCTPLRGLIDIVLRMPRTAGLERCWQAIVIHSQATGVGLMFDGEQLGDVLPRILLQDRASRPRYARFSLQSATPAQTSRYTAGIMR